MSRRNFRLKGATKILNEQAIDELSKSPQEPSLDFTNASVLVSTEPQTENILPLQALNATPTSTSQIYLGSAHDSGSINSIASKSTIPAGIPSSSSSLASSSSSALTSSATFSVQANQPSTFTSPQLLPCDIKSLLECPICFDYVVPPIYQCQNGHLVCQSCSSKITQCPTCRVPITKPSIRNLQLDRLASTFQFPCKYNFNGCQWKSYWFKKRDHEDDCDFISYPCPCPGTTCKWSGLLSQVMPHLTEHHKSITTLSGEDIVFLATDINLKGAVDWVMIQSCFNHHFLLVLEKQESKSGQQQFFAIVQLIGSQRETEKFKYKLELSSNISGQIKRLQWEATPRSILDGTQSTISAYDCLVFDARTAQHFLSPIQKDKEIDQTESQGENLGINVTIDCLI